VISPACPFDVFLVCNYAVLLPWALLIGFPTSPWTTRIVHSMAIPVLLAAVYVWAFAALPQLPAGGGFASLEGVMKLFSDPYAVLAGWVHYLVFDLFIGAWELRDSQRLGIAHRYVVPCLLFTLMLGPIGLGLYLLLRLALRGHTGLAEQGA